MWPYIQTLAGLVVLVAAGDSLVRGSVSLAARLGVSKLVISLTVVAFGTSAPELVVGIGAALKGVPTLSLGNVVGSNIANVFLVLGLPALLSPILSKDGGTSYNIGFMLVATVMLVGMAATGTLMEWHGVLLMAALAAFILMSLRRGRRDQPKEHELQDVEGMPAKPYGVPLAIAFTLAGLVGLTFGADLLVEGSTALARRFGISEVIIGLTIVAVGTSLPELATSFMAAWHRHGDVALGNVIGSNIFNIFGILGVTAVITPIPIPPQFMSYDLPVMAAAALALSYFVMKHRPLGRVAGIGFLTLYSAYVAGLVFWVPGSA